MDRAEILQRKYDKQTKKEHFVQILCTYVPLTAYVSIYLVSAGKGLWILEYQETLARSRVLAYEVQLGVC